MSSFFFVQAYKPIATVRSGPGSLLFLAITFYCLRGAFGVSQRTHAHVLPRLRISWWSVEAQGNVATFRNKAWTPLYS
jgi:hypothetical protein